MKAVFLPIVAAVVAGLLAGQTANQSQPESDRPIDNIDIDAADKGNGATEPTHYDSHGASFTFLTQSTSDTEHTVLAEEFNGNIINDALYSRTEYVEEELNIRLSELKNEAAFKLARNASMAADPIFDALSLPAADMASSAMMGLLHDLSRFERLDLDGNGWDSGLIEATSIMDSVFFASGLIDTRSYDETSAIFYNRELFDALSLDYPTQAVLDGLWTFDKFGELVISTLWDINGDAVITYDESGDIFGAASSTPIAELLYSAAGHHPIALDSDGRLTLKTNARLDALCTTLNTAIDTYGVPYIDSDANELFAAGRSTFYIGKLGETAAMRRTCDFDFGILPLPKSSAAQKSYVSKVDASTAPAVGVGVICGDPELASIVLDRLAAISEKYVLPAYTDSLLRTKHTRDTQSEEMLDIILNNRTMQLHELYGIDVSSDKLDAAIEKINNAYTEILN